MSVGTVHEAGTQAGEDADEMKNPALLFASVEIRRLSERRGY